MTNTVIELSEDAFAALFPLTPNFLNPGAGWQNADGDGCLFEPFAQELDFVRSRDARHVWTLADGDDGQCLLSGIHVVNRIGYLISTVAVPQGVEIHVRFRNRPRAERLALFAKTIACYPDFDPATNLVDLLADAMHWSAAADIRFEESLKTAALHFNNETTA